MSEPEMLDKSGSSRRAVPGGWIYVEVVQEQDRDGTLSVRARPVFVPAPRLVRLADAQEHDVFINPALVTAIGDPEGAYCLVWTHHGEPWRVHGTPASVAAALGMKEENDG